MPAQELSGLAGAMGTGLVPRTSYAWELEYRRTLGSPRLAWSAAWLNEGHDAEHHRDGIAVEAWALPVLDPDDFSLAIGAGLYRFADTRFWPGDGYTNEHGVTPIISVSATFYTDSPWFFRLTGNQVVEYDGFETHTIMAGIGYRLGYLGRTAGGPARVRGENTLTVMAGRTIVNSRSSEQATATVVEYRRGIARHWDWTVSWLDEGDPRVMRRHGAATQVWFTDRFRSGGLSVGLGVGPYLMFAHENPPDAPPHGSGDAAVIVTPTVACHLGAGWQARLSWNRIFSHDNHDADAIVMGLGYRWGRR